MCLFFPARCLTCGKAVRAQRLVCRACAASLPQKPFFQEFPLSQAQEGRLEVVAPLSYEKGTRRTLHRLKFQEERALAKPLAALMAQAVGQWGREFDGVVWVPMSPKKLQQRGYNQSQLLAKALAKELGLPWWTLLEQARETATQHNLTRAQRADNVRGAYRARAEAAGQRLLLVDDIQFIADKERTQDEFFHTFNVLHDSGKQIILTADKPPKGIAMLKERLASRFEGGLLADIFPPDYETRVAILAEKSRTERIVLEDDSVLPFIANIVKSNIRQLEGTLNRVVAFSNLTGKPITLELAQTALADYVSRPKVITAKDVQAAVCNYFSVSLVDLCSTRRSRELAVPRQIAMYLVRDMTDLSLPDIGKLFDKHHSTVLHACDKIGAERKENQSLNKTLEDIKSSLTE